MNEYEYSLMQIRPSDKRANAQLDALLHKEGISRDANLEYTVGLFDSKHALAATGSTFANTLRCLAVDSAYQGEGLMNAVVSHLISQQAERGVTHLFLYTKENTAVFFSELSFYEIARVPGSVVFMENRRNGFASFLEALSRQRKEGKSCALVMNCNPFTLGHRHLVECASRENDAVHLFVVSEDASFFPFADRFELVRKGCEGLDNIFLHQTGSYMISSAVFPSYFLESGEAAIRAQARLDIALFVQIARALGVTRRYVGEEPFSKVTGLYNETMMRDLPQAGLECILVSRITTCGSPISASAVRKLIHEGNLDAVKELVPPSTYAYLETEAGQKVVRAIQCASNVIHY